MREPSSARGEPPEAYECRAALDPRSVPFERQCPQFGQTATDELRWLSRSLPSWQPRSRVKDDIARRFEQNLERVENLLSVYPADGARRRDVRTTDLLRAAVVLLHASLE